MRGGLCRQVGVLEPGFVNQFLDVDLSPMLHACFWRQIPRSILQLSQGASAMLLVCIETFRGAPCSEGSHRCTGTHDHDVEKLKLLSVTSSTSVTRQILVHAPRNRMPR